MTLLLENRDLLDRFRAGDRAALATVFDHYSDVVARYLRGGFTFTSGEQRLAFRGVSNRHDLQDLVAETMRKAFEERARQAYDGLREYGTYLRRIARNLVIDQLRRKTHRFESLDDPSVHHAEEGTPRLRNPSGLFERKELGELLSSYMTGLGEDAQRFIALRYLEQRSQEEVAAAMGVTRRWVRNLERRIRKGLVAHLARSGFLRRKVA